MPSRIGGRIAPGLVRPMVARNPAQEHRTSTPLELLVDLCFTVAVAQAALQLQHELSAGAVRDGLIGYGTVFFAIWWAWMNFTWFASTYDTDDVSYRLITLLQIAGVLVLAAGVPRASAWEDFRTVVAGYAVMRLGLVVQWLRAARSYPTGRRTALRYATGVSTCWLGWAVLLTIAPPAVRLPLWPLLALSELAVPLWARRAGASPWHPQHIAERYGLFTLIVLGESVLASTQSVQVAIDLPGAPGSLYAIAVGGLTTMFAMWWLYFARPAHGFLRSTRIGFVWGYGHLLVFASAAAVGTGLHLNVDLADGRGHVSRTLAQASFTVPVVVFLLTVWLLHLSPHGSDRLHHGVFLLAGSTILALTWTPLAVPGTGAVTAALVAAVVLPPDPVSGDRTHRSRAARTTPMDRTQTPPIDLTQ